MKANFGSYFDMRQMRVRIAAFLLASAVAYAATPPADAQARTAVERDVEGYAIASCLAAQDQSYLKDQGNGWASAIIQRGKGDIGPLKAVTAAVNAELAKGDMAIIRSEKDSMKDMVLPVMYCGEIIDAPPVHGAIKKAVKALAPDYRTH
jgi:hypothetical protein